MKKLLLIIPLLIGCSEEEQPIDEIFGCTDSLAFNYNSNANSSNETCLFNVVVDFNTTSTNTTQNYSVTIDTITLILGSEEITEGGFNRCA